MKNKISITGETDFIDEGAREYLKKLETKIATLNERTKVHTLDIRELKKSLKELK